MATNAEPLSRPLFGGSFSAIIPPHSMDVSDIREIPDNQEVFIHSGTDQSIVIELLEHQVQVPDQEAARYHFADMTSSNDATGVEGTEIFSVEPVGGDQIALQDPSSAWFLSGRQQVAKFNEQRDGDGILVVNRRSPRPRGKDWNSVGWGTKSARNTVMIYLALFRLPQYSTDILITFNDPTEISPFSSSTEAVGESSSSPTQPWSLEQFRATVRSFRLLDPAIFP